MALTLEATSKSSWQQIGDVLRLLTISMILTCPRIFPRPDTLDPALLRPGRIDRRIEFSLPDNEGRAHILRIHARSMSVERDIRFDLVARLCPNTTGAELKSVATEVSPVH